MSIIQSRHCPNLFIFPLRSTVGQMLTKGVKRLDRSWVVSPGKQKSSAIDPHRVEGVAGSAQLPTNPKQVAAVL